MSEESKEVRYRRDILKGYETYGIWINGQLEKMRDDAPEWLKKHGRLKSEILKMD